MAFITRRRRIRRVSARSPIRMRMRGRCARIHWDTNRCRAAGAGSLRRQLSNAA
ncbi:hypothetical protein [Lysobacter gummosus]|uniref:hypothetical protein n=1 Tax=Lysobacter gummosus TaxID=262324 RepID=UPI00363DE269